MPKESIVSNILYYDLFVFSLPDSNSLISVMGQGAHDAGHCFFSFFFLMQMESYFPNWFMNSEEAKVLHVGAEWMNVLRGRIMGPKACQMLSDTCIVSVISLSGSQLATAIGLGLLGGVCILKGCLTPSRCTEIETEHERE